MNHPTFFIPDGEYSADDIVSEARRISEAISGVLSKDFGIGISVKVRRFIDRECSCSGEWFRIEFTKTEEP